MERTHMHAITRGWVLGLVLLATALTYAAPARPALLVDPLQPRPGAFRTTPKAPANGAWGIILGGAALGTQGRGIAIDAPGKAVLYPSAGFFATAATSTTPAAPAISATGAIEVAVLSTAPTKAGDTTVRTLFDTMWAEPSMALNLVLTGAKLTATARFSMDKRVAPRVLTADVNWLTDTLHRVTVVWSDKEFALYVDGKRAQASIDPKAAQPKGQPMAVYVGNAADLKSPALAALCDLRLSADATPNTPALLPVSTEEPMQDVLLAQMAREYADRFFPVVNLLRKQKIPELDYAEAVAYRDIDDTPKALATITPITANPTHRMHVPAVFLRADLLMDRKDFTGAFEQLQTLINAADIETRAMAQVKQADVLWQQGNTQEAMRLMSELITRYENEPAINNVYLRIAIERFKQRDFDSAYLSIINIGLPGALPKRFVAIGAPIEIKVADADLRTRVSDSGLTVVVVADSGDSVVAKLKPAFSKGIYLGSIETALGEKNPDDMILQVQGGDTVHVHYTDRLSAAGANVAREVSVGLRSDGALLMIARASLELLNEVRTYQAANVMDENWTVVGQLPDDASDKFRDAQGVLLEKGARIARTGMDTIIPSQSVYVELRDADLDVNLNAEGQPAGARVTDRLTAKDDKGNLVFQLVTRKGKKLDVVLEETGPATGVFAAIVKTTPDGTPMDGMLEVADNDTIIARYVDQLPAAGTLKNAYEARVSLAKTNGSMTVGIEYPNPALKDPANLDPERAKRIPPVLFSQALRVENNTTLTVRVDDRDLDKTDGKDSVTVQVAAASGATLPVVLTETGERTGVFAGSFKLMTNATAPSPKFLAAKPGDVVTITYTDTENPSDRPVAVPMQIKANILEDATVAIEHQVTIPADPANPKSRATTLWQPATMLIPGTLYRLSILDGDIVPPPGQTLARPFTLKASNGATLDLDLRGSVDKMTFGAAFSTEFYVRLGDRKSPQTTIITREGAVAENDEGGPTTVEGRAVPTINVQGTDTVDGTYIETVNAAGKKDQKLVKPFKVAADGTVALLDVLGGPLRTLKPGVSFVVKVVDPSGDLNPTPDKLKVKIVSTTGDTLADVEMHETGGHSGVFLAEVKTAVQKAADAEMTINIDFGGSLTATYTDVETVAGAPADRTAAITADDLLTAQAMLLTKVFDDEKFEEEALARLCESLYSLGAMELAATKLDPAQPRTNARLKEAGRLLGRLLERFPTSDYVVQALYLKGKISREERNYPDAKDLFTRIIDQYETTPFAPLAMNEMVGIAVDEKDIDAAIEMTKRLAHGFPTSSTVPEAFRRVADFYYRQKGTGYGTAASIYERMLVRFPDFKGIDGIRFRLATIYYNMGMADARNLDAFNKAGQHYLDYAKLYPNSDLADDALYWGASCYWKVPNAVRAYTMIMRLVGQYPGSDQVRGAELMKEQIRLANKGIEIDPELF